MQTNHLVVIKIQIKNKWRNLLEAGDNFHGAIEIANIPTR